MHIANMVVEFNSRRGWAMDKQDGLEEQQDLDFLSLLYSMTRMVMLSFPHAQLADIFAVSFSFSFGERLWNVNRMNRF